MTLYSNIIDIIKTLQNMDSFTIINDALQPKYTLSFETVTTEMHADKEIRLLLLYLTDNTWPKIWRTLNLPILGRVPQFRSY